MGMGMILDTSVLAAPRRRRFDLATTLRAYGDTEIGIAAITAAELVRAVVTAGDSTRAARRFYVDELLAHVPILPFGLAEAREHGRLAAALSSRGNAVGPHQMLVAATALSRDWAVMTLHPGDYEPVDGLVIAPLHRGAAAPAG